MRHLLTTQDLDREQLTMLLDTADGMGSILDRDIAKAPALRGKTVATMFFEPSTRTRLSFDKAAKALSADTMSFSASGSSLSKGESCAEGNRVGPLPIDEPGDDRGQHGDSPRSNDRGDDHDKTPSRSRCDHGNSSFSTASIASLLAKMTT